MTNLRVAVLLAGVGAMWAQPPRPGDQARTLLRSQILRDRAWGAWYAGVSHDSALIPLLIERLNSARSFAAAPRDDAQYAYVQSLFDALIELRASVPTAAMMPFENSWRNEILILLNIGDSGGDPGTYRRTIDSDGEPALLAMRRSHKGRKRGRPMGRHQRPALRD